MSTAIKSNIGPTFITLARELISNFLKDNLLKVPGVENLVECASSDDSSKKSCFLVHKHPDGYDIQVFIGVLPRTQMIAVSADVRDVILYKFKNNLNIDLRRVDIYIEEV